MTIIKMCGEVETTMYIHSVSNVGRRRNIHEEFFFLEGGGGCFSCFYFVIIVSTHLLIMVSAVGINQFFKHERY